MDAWLKWMIGAMLLLATLIFGLLWGIYAYGASSLPANIGPNPYRAPAPILRQYLIVEAGDVKEIPKLNPVTVWWHLYRAFGDDSAEHQHGLQLLDHASRILRMREPMDSSAGRHHANSIAGAVLISRNWSLPDVVNTLLGESSYGRNAIGIESASLAYFGIPLAQLRPEETLALIVLLKGPTYYDPICKNDRFAARYLAYSAKLHLESSFAGVAKATSRMLPAPCHSTS